MNKQQDNKHNFLGIYSDGRMVAELLAVIAMSIGSALLLYFVLSSLPVWGVFDVLADVMGKCCGN